jgi:alpha-N-acetylglucosamine transferase
LIVLTIINISAFGTILYNKIFTQKTSGEDSQKSLIDLKDSLKLSENQFCKMKECQCGFKNKMAMISEEIRNHKIKMMNILKEKNPDRAKINLILDKIDSLQSVHLRETANNLLEHSQIMNDEQREKFFSIILNDYSNQCDSICINNKNKNH